MNKRSNQAEMPHSFTPGPWETLEFSQHELQTDFAMVKVGKRVHMIGYSDEDKANAQLIAAAPDLLDVAEMVLALATIDTPPELIKAATAAIAKARGAA